MNLTTEGFVACARAALEELDANASATEIRRVETWIERLNKEIHLAKRSFSDQLGERNSAEDPDVHYAEVRGYLQCDGEGEDGFDQEDGDEN